MRRSSEIQKIEDEIELHRKSYRWKLFGKIFLFLLIIGAVAGVFGRGGLSKRKELHGPVFMEYDYFLRYKSKTTLSFTVDAMKLQKDTVIIGLSDDFFECFRIEDIEPAPFRLQKGIGKSDHVFVFPKEPVYKIEFHLEPEKAGKSSKEVWLPDGRIIILNQFTYP